MRTLLTSQAFSNMTEHTRRLLCEVMVFAVVPKEGSIVMKDGEELDSWSVILNGEVEVTRHSGETTRLSVGDWYTCLPACLSVCLRVCLLAFLFAACLSI